MELIKQQVWVPRQTPGAGHGGAHQASVTCAPAAIALCLWLCSHKPHRERERERDMEIIPAVTTVKHRYVNNMKAITQTPDAADMCVRWQLSSLQNESEHVLKPLSERVNDSWLHAHQHALSCDH